MSNMPNYSNINYRQFQHTVAGKATIGSTLHTLYGMDAFMKLSEPSQADNPALLIDDEYIIPIISETDKSSYGVNIKKGDMFAIAKLPKESDPNFKQYTVSGNDTAINFKDITSVNKYIDAVGVMEKSEIDIITTPDNIFQPTPTKDDTPAMNALKQAVCEKHIDIDKYEMRFGSNFNNDKRLFNKNSISLPMLTRLCNGLDIKASLTLEDKESNTPNPIGRSITIELTGGSDNDDE